MERISDQTAAFNTDVTVLPLGYKRGGMDLFWHPSFGSGSVVGLISVGFLVICSVCSFGVGQASARVGSPSAPDQRLISPLSAWMCQELEALYLSRPVVFLLL